MSLKTDYKNYVPSAEMGGLRRYTKIDNPDGTVSFQDKTTYETEGDRFGATDINATNKVVNAIMGDGVSVTYEESTVKITAPADASVITFLAPSNFSSSDKYTINGTPVTLVDLNGSAITNGWKQGSPVQFFVQGSKAYVYITSVPDTVAASKISAGTLGTGVVASVGTDYTTSRIRNIKFGTEELEDGVSPLESGTIYIQYSVE